MNLRIQKRNIFTFEIFGYGINCTILYGGDNKDGSLEKFGINKFWSRWDNPYITFVIFYKWITFRLLLNKG